MFPFLKCLTLRVTWAPVVWRHFQTVRAVTPPGTWRCRGLCLLCHLPILYQITFFWKDVFRNIAVKYLMFPYQQTLFSWEGNRHCLQRYQCQVVPGAFGVTLDPPVSLGGWSNDARWDTSQDMSTKTCILCLSMCVVSFDMFYYWLGNDGSLWS